MIAASDCVSRAAFWSRFVVQLCGIWVTAPKVAATISAAPASAASLHPLDRNPDFADALVRILPGSMTTKSTPERFTGQDLIRNGMKDINQECEGKAVSSLRTRGAMCAPRSSIERSIFSCESAETPI